jgi:hypothetical protein
MMPKTNALALLCLNKSVFGKPLTLPLTETLPPVSLETVLAGKSAMSGIVLRTCPRPSYLWEATPATRLECETIVDVFMMRCNPVASTLWVPPDQLLGRIW